MENSENTGDPDFALRVPCLPQSMALPRIPEAFNFHKKKQKQKTKAKNMQPFIKLIRPIQSPFAMVVGDSLDQYHRSHTEQLVDSDSRMHGATVIFDIVRYCANLPLKVLLWPAGFSAVKKNQCITARSAEMSLSSYHPVPFVIRGSNRSGLPIGRDYHLVGTTMRSGLPLNETCARRTTYS